MTKIDRVIALLRSGPKNILAIRLAVPKLRANDLKSAIDNGLISFTDGVYHLPTTEVKTVRSEWEAIENLNERVTKLENKIK